VGDQSPDYKDWDGDGELIDPFDGYGLLPDDSQIGYLQAIYSEAALAANASGATLGMINHGEEVKICAQNLATWAAQLRDTLLTIHASPAGSDLDQQVANAVRIADQLLNGVDLDQDRSVEFAPGECGLESAVEAAYFMADMPILPVDIVPAATVTGPPNTPSPTSTRAPIIPSATKTKNISEPQNTPAPAPAATKPGGRPPDKPKPTKKNNP
jgi:hypothetical protein